MPKWVGIVKRVYILEWITNGPALKFDSKKMSPR